MRRWRYTVFDNSLTTLVCNPVWNWVVTFIPKECAPNAITLAGFICVVLSHLVAASYRSSHPVLTAVSCAVLGTTYFHLDALDGKHARNTGNSSPLGELFDHACDNLTTALATVTLFWVLGVEDTRLLWVACQMTGLQFCFEHLCAYRDEDKAIRFSLLDGPGEVFFLFIGSGLLHNFKLLDPVWAAGVKALWTADEWVEDTFPGWGLDWPCCNPTGSRQPQGCEDPTSMSLFAREVAVLAAYFAVVLKITSSILWLPKAHHSSKVWLLLTLFIRAVPALVVLSGMYSFGGDWACGDAEEVASASVEVHRQGWWQSSRHGSVGAHAALPNANAGEKEAWFSVLLSSLGLVGPAPSVNEVLLDGMFVSIITSELIVAKMADRQVHPLLAVLALASTAGPGACGACLVLYYGSVFWDLCQGLNLPLLNPVVNVYCDGVFDMLHIGHMKQFESALKAAGGGGARLLVGVHGDDDCIAYKRKPVMNEQERYDTVRACKFVSEVVERAPLKTDVAFLAKHKIHIVACGEEYFYDPNDEYYTVPRALGILRPTPRTRGVSTSDIIARVRAHPADKPKKSNGNGDAVHPVSRKTSRSSAW